MHGIGRWVALAILVALVTACGGGDDGPTGAADGGNTGDAVAPTDGSALSDAVAGDAVALDAGGDAAPLDVASGDAAADATPDGALDGGAIDGGPGDAGGAVDAGEDGGPDVVWPLPAEFPRGLPPTEALGSVRGYVLARTIIHLHSLYSHDACDGQPLLEDGSPNEDCLADLREALCDDAIDYAMMTEHTGRMAETLDFEELFLHRDGDTWIDEDGRHSANVVACANGHRPLLMPGLEGGGGEASPIGLTGHPVQGTAAEIRAGYADSSPEGLARMRAQHAVPSAIHLEGQDPVWLRATGLDAVEIGNLHVLIAPNYRMELGLDAATGAVAFVEWVLKPQQHPPADLVFLEFHEHLPLYREGWDAILGERMITGFAGNDAHQNVADTAMGDGERPDGYRRMMKWYVNHLLVHERTPAEGRAALAAGRLYMVFEILGSPVAFDFYAEGADGTVAMMGEVLDSGGDPGAVHLRATAPDAQIGDVVVPVATLMRLYRVTADGTELVAGGERSIDLAAPGPGRYRLEIDVNADHLAQYLGTRPQLLRTYPWIYSNPIEIR